MAADTFTSPHGPCPPSNAPLTPLRHDYAATLHGDRGAAALLPDRRCGADGRLRQDHAWPAHGRGIDGPPGDLSVRGADAARALGRHDAGLGVGHLEVLGGPAGADRLWRGRRVSRDVLV